MIMNVQKYRLTLTRLNEEIEQGSPEMAMENNRKAKMEASKSKLNSTSKTTSNQNWKESRSKMQQERMPSGLNNDSILAIQPLNGGLKYEY